MTALADIQRALNTIRRIERASTINARLGVLALVTGTADDIARELRGAHQSSKAKPNVKGAAKPKPLPIPKPLKRSKPVSPSKPLQPKSKPKPLTRPEL